MRIVLIACLCAMLALAGNLSGVWSGSMPGRDGHALEVTFNFKVEGEKLTGTMTGGGGAADIADGKVAGDVLTFKAQGASYEGKLVGDTIAFKAVREGAPAPVEFVARRK